MKLTFKKTASLSEEKEVELPFYFKKTDKHFPECGMVFKHEDDLRVFAVYYSEMFLPPTWVASERSHAEFTDEVEPVTKEEFETVLDKFIDSLTKRVETIV